MAHVGVVGHRGLTGLPLLGRRGLPGGSQVHGVSEWVKISGVIDPHEAIRMFPLVLKRLRLRAGFKSQRAATRAIRRKTGIKITPTRFSHWELGRSLPQMRSMLAVLKALEMDFRDLQDELDRATGLEVARPAASPAAAPETAAATREPSSSASEASSSASATDSTGAEGQEQVAQQLAAIERRLRQLEGRDSADS